MLTYISGSVIAVASIIFALREFYLKKPKDDTDINLLNFII